MTDLSAAAWPALLALGAGHGINPAMGWLFAVALGMQRGGRGAVWAALLPLAAGHAAAIGAVVAVAGVLGIFVPIGVLRWGVGGVLVGLGVWRLVRPRHIRFGGMQVDGRELAVWSFLMASAHGAGLMLLPLVMKEPVTVTTTMMHQMMLPAGASWNGVWATAVHTAGYLAVTGALAVLVYEKLGLRLLRVVWINVDRIWAAALVLTGLFTWPLSAGL